MANTDLERVNDRLRAIEANLREALNHIGLEWKDPTPTDDVPAEVIELVKAGDRIGAAKLYRDLTGSGLAEAQKRVAEIMP